MELAIKEIVLDLLAYLKFEEASARVERQTDRESEDSEVEQYLVEIDTTAAPLLIGRHGDNLRAFQHILKMIVSKKAQEFNRKASVLVDVDGYRKRQEEESLELAMRRAEQVRRSGNPIKLPPMSGYQRRLIHLELMKYDDLETDSTGEGRFRAIVIKRKE